MYDTGFGESSFGDSILGYGAPFISNSTTKKEFLLQDGSSNYGNIERIDPLSRDYVLTEDGLYVGDKSVNQQVYFCLFTLNDSSSISGFGLDLSDIQVLTDNTQQKFESAVRQALSPLINRNIISLQSVTYRRLMQNRVTLNIEWIDLSSGERNYTKLNPSV